MTNSQIPEGSRGDVRVTYASGKGYNYPFVTTAKARYVCREATRKATTTQITFTVSVLQKYDIGNGYPESIFHRYVWTPEGWTDYYMDSMGAKVCMSEYTEET